MRLLLISGAFALGLAAMPAPAATFTVDSTADTVDINPGDGICADVNGACTLRAAVMEADALGGASTVDLTGINRWVSASKTHRAI